MTTVDRMPPLDPATMSAAQRNAAEALAAGPRGGVKGPFIPLLRSPELMDALQKVGEYLRFRSSLDPRIREFLMLVVSRQWSQQLEWFVHVPLALRAGVKEQTLQGLAAARRPPAMAEDEAMAYDLCDELLRTHGVSDATYRNAVDAFSEAGIIDILGLIGYFSTMSMVLNVAHTPTPPGESAIPLAPLPL